MLRCAFSLRKMRRIPNLTLALCIAITGMFCSAYSSAAEAPKNVLFLICDDLNIDVSTFGHPLVATPQLDRLAARGVRFDNAHCQFPLCGPSRASFMTGLYPDQTLIRENSVSLRERLPRVKTLSQMFRNQGHLATRIGKVYHYNVPSNIGTAGHDDPDSWDQTFCPRGRDVIDEEKITSIQPGYFGASLSYLAAEGSDAEQTDGMSALKAVEILRNHAEEGSPFFLAVGLFRPHTPYVAPEKYFELYPLDKIEVPKVPEGYFDTIPKPAAKSVTAFPEQRDLDPEFAKKAIQAYYASISFADAQLGVVLDSLEETGLVENTIIVFISDHGYHMGEHGHYQKKTLFEAATRVPLIISAPEQKLRGTVNSSPTELIDIYPTLAELAGYAAPNYLQGKSLVSALNDPEARPREDALSQIDGGYSLRTDRYRYTEWGDEGAEGTELYDHNSDPAEMKNLAEDPEQKETIGNLSKRLRERVAAAREKPQRLLQFIYEKTKFR